MKSLNAPLIWVGLSLTATNLQAAILSNGSFETGDFTSWITSDLSDPLYALSVSTGSVTHGTYAATSGFDGDGPGTISIAQDIGILSPGSKLSFDYSANVDDFGGPDSDRVFSVSLQPNGGGTPIHTFEVFRAPSGQYTDTGGYVSENLDLSPYSGQNVRVSFELFVPHYYNGPAYFNLDNVALAVPESATAGVFAAAGLMGFALWRRRAVKTRA